MEEEDINTCWTVSDRYPANMEAELYEKKFTELQKYIPFLNAMIDRLKKVRDNSRQSQLQKMQSLYSILSNNNRKLTIGKLEQCEQVILKLRNKFGKLHGGDSDESFDNKETELNMTERENQKAIAIKEEPYTTSDSIAGPSSSNIKMMKKEETPASPSPPASPDQTSQPEIMIPTRIIPTERNDGYTGTLLDDRPASPDACEMIATIGMRQPIIIPTEPLNAKPKINPLRKVDGESVNARVSRWGSTQDTKPPNLWQTDLPQSTGIDTIMGRTSAKPSEELRPQILRHISTMPAPSKGSSLLRKPVLLLDKNTSQATHLDTSSPKSKWEMTKPVGVPTPRLHSPESEPNAHRGSKMSPKAKELPPLPRAPATPLLVAPPPVLTVPPLTSEDLLELLQDNDPSINTTPKAKDKEDPRRLSDEAKNLDKTLDSKRNIKNHGQTQNEADQENERRWEEEYMHIVKMTGRKGFTSPSKNSDGKGLSSATSRPTDPRPNRPPSPPNKVREPEPRYADNYEKHPRPRDPYKNIPVHEVSPIISAFPRHPDGDSNMSLVPDDRNSPLYQRRPYNGPKIQGDPHAEPRRDNSELYTRGHQRDRDNQMNVNRPPMHHSPGRSGDPCNQGQWGPNSNYPQGPQGPNMPYQQRPDMWMMNQGPNNGPMDQQPMMNDQPHMRQPPYPSGPNNCGRPMMSPQDMNHGPCMDQGYRDNAPMIPPLIPQLGQHGPQHPNVMPPQMQSQGYPMGPQYHGYPGDNQSNGPQQFERPQDYPHPRPLWEQPVVNRPPDNISYPRSPGPSQWNRSNRGQPAPAGAPLPPQGPMNRDRPYNDRPRGSDTPRPGFNRDPRKRAEPSVLTPPQNVNPPPPPLLNTRRDNRFAKDTPQVPPTKPKETSVLSPKSKPPTSDRNARRKPDVRESKYSSSRDSSRDPRRLTDKKRSEQKSDKKTENDAKNVNEKSSKDVMQSPLESLYGVIDTSAKTGKGYGFQKYKIPKKPRPPSPPRAVAEPEENWDTPDDIITQIDTFVDNTEISPSRNRESDDKKSEVISTSSKPVEEHSNSKVTVPKVTGDSPLKETPVQLTEDCLNADPSTKNGEEKTQNEAEPPKFKEEVTKQWLQDFILQCLKAGEGKKILEELQVKKKMKKISKILDSEPDDSSSNEDDDKAEMKKVGNKKKRRVIVSDTSEDECLAERLINTPEESTKDGSIGQVNKNEQGNTEESTAIESPEKPDELDDQTPDTRTAPSKKGKPFRRKKRERKGKSPTAAKNQSIDDASVGDANEVAEQKTSPPPPTKTKPKRRNSLEMLQEDIREMFISEGVMGATGHRMCRLIKEAQSTLNSESQSKKGTTSPLESLNAESEGEGRTLRPSSSNSRGKRGTTRSKRKTRPRGRTSWAVSSDSETEDSARIQTPILIDPNATKTSDESMRSDVATDPLILNKTESEENPYLRRSGRGHRDSSRNLKMEKSEPRKPETSKRIFDSSSDESFDIDVSELAAAVDISLHPEPQAEASLSTKKKATGKKRATTKRGNTAKAVEEKMEVASADEVESIASDMSRTSSLTRGKKSSTAAGQLDTNEELLSDLLVSLDKAPEGKNVNARPSTRGAKSNVRRKKKKKGGWKMGVLSTKKKKKAPTPIPTCPNDPEVEHEQEAAEVSPPELDSSFEISGEVKNKSRESSTPPKEEPLSTAEVEPKEEIHSDASPSKLPIPQGELRTTLTIDKEEPCSPTKDGSSRALVDDPLAEPKDEPTSETNKSDCTELPIETVQNFGIKKLMAYFWSAKKDKFNCLFCPFLGKNIIHHYALSHTDKEVMISRFNIPESKRAIAQVTASRYNMTTPKRATKENRKFSCRFCTYTTEGSAATALEAFYEHCTTHTGEYRFRCAGCSYQTVARSSMKTHYYRKSCDNKFHGNINEAINEDPIPDDDFLFGYMCTKCNFVQLKEDNVKRHVKVYHEKLVDVHIAKIDMSSFVEEDLYTVASTTSDTTMVNSPELKTEDDQWIDVENNAEMSTEIIGSDKALKHTEKFDTAVEDLTEPKPEITAMELESDVLTPCALQETLNEGPAAGNLNAFVCPPELENKEDEIQLQRQKKMQEIVDDIGINKGSEKRDLSIIDMLKDKMTTDLEAAVEEAEAMPSVNQNSTEVTPEKSSINLPVLVPESVTSLAPKEDINVPSKEIGDAVTPRELDETAVKNEPSETTIELKIQTGNENDDKSEKKMVDPLSNLDEFLKDDSTDCDASDTEIDEAQPAPITYESDSSEQSEAGPADVDSLLEETFNISATANAPMMTTIQRLAAKLQGEKGDKTEIPENLIPKAPEAIPIASLQKFFDRRNAMLQEVAKEVAQAEQAEEADTRKSSPKNFIRLRRLSGDKLSIPVPSPEKVLELNELSQSSIIDEILQKNTEEECSFLRIENVVSLAPSENSPNDTMINDIRKAVANTKNSMPISVLKNANTTIVMRAGTNITGPIPIRPAGITLPVMPVSPSRIGKSNFKILKVVRGLPVIKQKDSNHRIFGAGLKNPETFAEMLQLEKLRHFYKCMSRTCTYTTDCLKSFEQHYRQHKESEESRSVLATYDFQRCAYCSETLTTWNAMSEHLKDRHIFCQYQCSYCFYRALAQSYVELHQITVHSALPTSVLIGVRETPPIETIDRREFVTPYICHHECGKAFYVPGAFLAHLRTKHGNSLSIFKCHLCPAASVKADKLVVHYKLHGIFRYQCLYCLFGSEDLAGVHAHLSASHYNRPPHVLERALQPRPVKDRDIVQQLIIHNVDETSKPSELTLGPGQDSSDTPRNRQWLEVDADNSVDSPASDSTVTIGNIGMNRLFPYEKLNFGDLEKNPDSVNNLSTPTTPTISKAKKILPKTPPENILVMDDNGMITKISKRKELIFDSPTKISLEKLQAIKTPRPLVITSTDPLKLNPEDIANYNIADVIVESSSEIDIERVEKLENKNDSDSDIEILEDIDLSIKKMSVIPEKVTSETAAKGSPVVTKIITASDTTVTLSPVPESVKNSPDTNISANPTGEPDVAVKRPMTLDDIRHTGFVGEHLYQCGYDDCNFRAENSVLLKNHMKDCTYATLSSNNLNCVHCNKRFVKIGFLLEHFKMHGLKVFGCSLCNCRWPMSYQAIAHMKAKHRQPFSKLVPADPANPSRDGLFIVSAVDDPGKGKKRGKGKSTDNVEKSSTAKVKFGPTEIESLPRQAIYQRAIHCAVCSYTTKVRTNIIRHLQLHAKDESVPESGPVNPVPCLDKKERMFDKMVNLASSSHQNGRMGGKPAVKETIVDADAEFLPKFVPENKRYVCGVAECSYLSIDEGMLRSHVKALHPDEPYFRCPHCPAPMPGHDAQNIAIEKMGVHLKMHDTRLYKCSHCNHHHYHRHVVDRHLTEKHPEATDGLKVIREPDMTENPPQAAPQEDADDGAGDPEGNYWKCNVCDYKCVYKADMVTHASSIHEEKSQFKCTACHWKSNNKMNFDQHVIAKHSIDPNVDCTLVYQKIKGTAPKRPTDTIDTGSLSEPFDTTPLWRRDMPRVRHIRGILFEDEASGEPESPARPTKRKSDDDITKTMKIKVPKSLDVSSQDSVATNSTISSSSSVNRKLDLSEDYDENESDSLNGKMNALELIKKFGHYGKPLSNFYRCPLCITFKTRYRHDMRDHLYRDLKYYRYGCSLCMYEAISKTAALKHFMKCHESRRPTESEQVRLAVDIEKETWVQTLLRSQSAQIRGIPVDFLGKVHGEFKRRRSGPNSQKSTSGTSFTQSLVKDTSVKAVTVDLTKAIDDMNKKSAADDTDCDVPSICDDDSNDNDNLVIDNKDDGLEEQDLPDDSVDTVTGSTGLSCKHCGQKFTATRGLKMHVQIRHLKRLTFLCPFCDTSSNSEKLLRNHLRLKHPERQGSPLPNPTINPPELTDEFWEKEYGLTVPERQKKRKRARDDTGNDPYLKIPGVTHLCTKCDFRAVNLFGLGVHQRTHTNVKSFKCAYCTYNAATKTDLRQHAEYNHADLDWNLGNEDSLPGTSNAKSTESKDIADYENLVEGSTSSVNPINLEMIYNCFYCNTTRKSLDGVKEHWNIAHKNTTNDPLDASTRQTAMPFRYTELLARPTKKILRCGYCPKRGSAATIRLHSRKTHEMKPVKFVEIPVKSEGWICLWCKEFCENEAKKKIHQNMFHSHLSPNFQAADKIQTEDLPDKEEGANCPAENCTFKTTSVAAMEKHVTKHVDSVRCKRCEMTFPNVSLAIMHNRQMHPHEVSKIEGFTANVEKIMAKVIWGKGDLNRTASETVARSALGNWRKCGVAKKSTTKSTVAVKPSPTDFRAVARKSTNPLPRYPPGIRFDIGTTEICQGYSYYGKPRDPVNLNNISTYFTVGGGRQMKFNCTTLAQFINLEPSVIVEDYKKTKTYSIAGNKKA